MNFDATEKITNFNFEIFIATSIQTMLAQKNHSKHRHKITFRLAEKKKESENEKLHKMHLNWVHLLDVV